MIDLLENIMRCTICSGKLPLGPNPVLSASEKSKILIVGQAPGLAVHKSKIPWNDKSGENLRSWLGVGNDMFYNTDFFGIVPMAFCYPGKGKTGDLPPSKECAPKWHAALKNHMEELELILLVGKYAQDYYLPHSQETLTERVKNYEAFLPLYFVLPHPSPRNNIWQAKNMWFGQEVIPELRNLVHRIIA